MLLALALVARAGHAETTSDASTLGHELFDQGRALMKEKNYAAACAKFEDSERLDPGGGTILNLALCHELSGKTATAWVEFREGARLAVRDGRKDRLDFAEQHIAALTPRLSRLAIEVPPRLRVPGLVVRRNGVPIGESAWGEALAVDPGRQEVEVRAPHKVSTTLVVDVGADGDVRTLLVPALADASRPKSGISTRERPQEPPFFTPHHMGGAALGAVGLTGIAMGAVFGVNALAERRDADAACPDPDHCRAIGIYDSQDAVADARKATFFIAGGVVMLAVGGLLFLTSPKPAASKSVASALRANGALLRF